MTQNSLTLPQLAHSPKSSRTPPSTPDDIRAWFHSVVHRDAKRDKSLEKVNRLKALSTVIAREDEGDTPTGPMQLHLTETETIFILTINTSFSPDDPEDIERVTKENEDYEKYLQKRPKSLDAETQTPKLHEKWKGCETVEIKIRNSFVNASAWDLYDTYAEVAADAGLGVKEFQLLIDTALKSKGVLAAQIGASANTRLPADKQMQLLHETKDFQYCVLAIERLLASKTYEKKQCFLKKRPRKKFDPVEPSLFSYELRWLWTYDIKEPKNLLVSSLDWNPANAGLLAVGYGGGGRGLVCIWSPKNPNHPERIFNFPCPVSSICFSTESPNLLAVGCHDGHIFVLDASLLKPQIHHFPRGGIPFRFGPIWKLEWFVPKLTGGKREDLMAVGEAGRLLHLSLHNEKSCEELLKLEYTTKISSPFQVNPNTEYSSKMLAGLWFSLVPDKCICYISSKEGIVAKCILRKPCYIDVQLSAHLGPAYVVHHSPWTSMIFLTSGADHCFRIWVEGINEPLLTLTSPVLGKRLSAVVLLKNRLNEHRRAIGKDTSACVEHLYTTGHLANFNMERILHNNNKRPLLNNLEIIEIRKALNKKKPLADDIKFDYISPLFNIRSTMLFAQWSPILPTVVATLSDSEIALWDLARKPTEPVNALRMRTADQMFSTLRFFPDGMGLVVGDQKGHVRVYQLSEMPREPFLKVEALTAAIKTALAQKESLLYKFNNILRFHKSEFQTKV